MAADAMTELTKSVELVPEDMKCWLGVRTMPGYRVVKSLMEFNRQGDILTQVYDHLVAIGLRGPKEVNLIVYGRKGKAPQTFGQKDGYTLDLDLPNLPAPAPVPVRLENPGPAAPVIDPMDALDRDAERFLKMQRKYGTKCRKCRNLESECTCICPCGSGLLEDICEHCEDCDETPCVCDEEQAEQEEAAKPKLGDVVIRKLMTEEGEKAVDDVLGGLRDLLRAGADRLRHGARPASRSKPVTEAVKKVAEKAAEAAPDLASVAPQSGLRIVRRVVSKAESGS